MRPYARTHICIKTYAPYCLLPRRQYVLATCAIILVWCHALREICYVHKTSICMQYVQIILIFDHMRVDMRLKNMCTPLLYFVQAIKNRRQRIHMFFGIVGKLTHVHERGKQSNYKFTYIYIYMVCGR